MSRTRQNLFVWLAIGAFALPSVLGSALHLLPGFQHGICRGHCAPSCGHADVHCEAHHHAHSPEVTAADAGGACHACPICQFTSAGKVVAPIVEIVWLTTAVNAATPVAWDFVCPLETPPFGPRGPPAFPAFCGIA